MNFFSRLFQPKEIKAVIGVLNEADHHFNNPDFNSVRGHIENMIFKNSDSLVDLIQKGTPPRKWVYFAINNISGDMLATGQYHIYRGTINPMGAGPNLFKLFNASLDELVKMGEFSKEEAHTTRQGLDEEIKQVG